MAYQYDVFLSYLHEPPSGTWVHDHFLPYFTFQLGNALNRRTDIFVDRTGIHLGEKWPIRLKQALAHSRCLVGVWAPLYFQSDWCQKECAIICHRERKLGYGRGQNSEGLLIGVKVNDGIHFPKFAKESQFADFEKYFFDGQGFARTEFVRRVSTGGGGIRQRCWTSRRARSAVVNRMGNAGVDRRHNRECWLSGETEGRTTNSRLNNGFNHNILFLQGRRRKNNGACKHRYSLSFMAEKSACH